MLKTFRIGGIHPPENKLSSDKKIELLPLPERVFLPLSQHIGIPAVPIVKKGDEVKAGTVIAKSGGFVSAAVHSSVSGKVVKIEEITDTSGYKRPAVFIDVEGDEWEEHIDLSPSFSEGSELSSTEIIEKIEAAGIVGLGGATFPTRVKVTPSPDMKAEYLLINAAECEPYLTSDHALMSEKGKEILAGARLLMKAVGADKIRIGIENNKKEVINHLSALASDYPEIQVVALKTKYPQGGEKQLVEALTGRRIKSGALPVSVGAVVQNVGTAFAVYEAVLKNKPLIERVVTVTGKSLKNPCNVRVRLGTPISELIRFAGGMPEDTGKIIAGGPMMGKAIVSPEVPVTKGCSGVLLMPANESLRKRTQNCIRCAKCVQVCPMGLVPSFLMNVSEFEDWNKAEKFDITDCIECGSCSYTCPANRPLLDYIRQGKGKVLKMIRERKN